MKWIIRDADPIEESVRVEGAGVARRISLAELREAAALTEPDLREVYTYLAERAAEEIERVREARRLKSISLCPTVQVYGEHRPVSQSTDHGYSTPVSDPDADGENPAAHGGVFFTEACVCGAMRGVNENCFEFERGSWR